MDGVKEFVFEKIAEADSEIGFMMTDDEKVFFISYASAGELLGSITPEPVANIVKELLASGKLHISDEVVSIVTIELPVKPEYRQNSNTDNFLKSGRVIKLSQ